MGLNFEWETSKARINMKRQKVTFMQKKPSDVSNHDQDDMRPEYAFRGGVRGKHDQAYRQGHTVTIHQEDKTIPTITVLFISEKN